MYKFNFRKAFIISVGFAMSLGMVSCGNDDEDINNIEDLPYVDSWGEVLRGDDMKLQFFPDHFAFYWEYTFSTESSPSLGLKIEGEFPDSRFLSYNVYDDDEQTSNCHKAYSIMDVDIVPDQGSSNPFLGDAAGDKKYTLYVLPVDAPESITAGKKNIIWYDSDVKKVCTILRYYIPEGGINGGVKMPMISGISLKDGSVVPAPKRELSGLRGTMSIPGGAFSSNDNMLFFRAPFSYAYPNGPAEYCYNRNVLEKEKVMVFNFKAPGFPQKKDEYKDAEMRYWSVCVGNQETYTPLAICDYQTNVDADGFANYILADKNGTDYAKVKEIAERKGYNVLEWDGEAWGDGVMILYRNMVFADDYPHSMRKLDPVGPGVNPMENPQKYIAVLGLGQWGATGKKVTSSEFIAADGNIVLRQPK